MQISDNGLHKIEGYEGWGKLIKDGPHAGCYAAYQDRFNGKLDVPTIGPGLTEDVHMGLVLTRDECSQRFRKELVKHEAAINKLVNVPISQNAYDALVSLSYNVGTGAVAKSTVLKRLNKGDYVGASEAFKLFNKAGGGVVKGLVQRRASEAALFLKPDEAPEKPSMPQTVTESAPPVTPAKVAVGTAVAAPAVVEVVQQTVPALPVPAVPEVVTQSISNVESWKGMGVQAWNLLEFGWQHPMQSLAVAVPLVLLWFWPRGTEAQE